MGGSATSLTCGRGPCFMVLVFLSMILTAQSQQESDSLPTGKFNYHIIFHIRQICLKSYDSGCLCGVDCVRITKVIIVLCYV